MSKQTFLICPVRGHSPEETRAIVEKLESDGWDVYWPPRDTDQNDTMGYRICCDNRAEMRKREYVHLIWDGKSQGGLFDLGMAFEANKKIIVVEIPPLTDGKSFQNMVYMWQLIQDETLILD